MDGTGTSIVPIGTSIVPMDLEMDCLFPMTSSMSIKPAQCRVIILVDH